MIWPIRSLARQAAKRILHTAVPAFPNGHYYSPVVDLAELQRDRARVFDRSRRITDVDLREASQLSLLAELASHYTTLPFKPSRSPGVRYHYDNPMFGYSDAVIYACMLAHRQPKRVVEIGSGYSSALLLDMRDNGLCGEVECHFIDPNPERLERLLRPEDAASTTVHRERIQDVPVSMFAALEAGDILFIDSSHVAKGGSDLCYEIFEVLPSLAPGVAIHFHDIFYPFEYPEDWFFQENRSWNEAYMLRALLAGTQLYHILLFGDFLHRFHGDTMKQYFSQSREGTGGSIWIEKTG